MGVAVRNNRWWRRGSSSAYERTLEFQLWAGRFSPFSQRDNVRENPQAAHLSSYRPALLFVELRWTKTDTREASGPGER